MSVNLAPNEVALKEQIETLVNKFNKAIEGYYDAETLDQWVVEAGTLAHQLHTSLSGRGIEPRHHAYMIENRGLPANDPNFYQHIHPIEDLLKFIDNEHANDDPQDQTIGDEFEFRVFSKRWGHHDTYRITRTPIGWDVSHIAIGGPCDKGGRPFLFENLKHDYIQYPARLDGWMEWLWNKAAEEGLSHAQLQTALNELAEWISSIEQSSPSGDIWDGF